MINSRIYFSLHFLWKKSLVTRCEVLFYFSSTSHSKKYHTVHYRIKLLTFITKNLKGFVKIFVFDRAMCAFSFMKSIFCWSKGTESQDFRPTFFGQKLLCTWISLEWATTVSENVDFPELMTELSLSTLTQTVHFLLWQLYIGNQNRFLYAATQITVYRV